MKTRIIRLIAIVLLAVAVPFGSAQTVVRVAPPAPPTNVGVIGRAPSPGYVWTNGYYRWHSGKYVWVGGRWVLPPRGGAIWVQPRWVHRSDGWVFFKGYWR